MASIVNVKDFDNLDYPQIGAGVGVIAAIIWCMTKRCKLGKTALIAILAGGAGAFLGYQIDKQFNQ